MDKAQLIAARAKTSSGFPEDNVEVPGVGTIRVRGMSREELINAGKLANDTLRQEQWVLSRVMLDPAMDAEDIAAWQGVSGASEINDVMMKVNELSGVKKGADKEAYKSPGGEPEPGV